MPYKYYLNEPFLEGKEEEYVLDVLRSRWLSIKGKHTRIFEEKFAEMVGLRYCFAVQSGTAALHTALLALGIKKGDKVVIPNFTCGGSASSVIQCGATPVILDVEPETFGLDYNQLEKYLETEKPKAVMIVHVYGFPARDTEKIVQLCREKEISVIEDCCEAHGAEINGKKVGTFGDIAVFSVRSEKMIGVGEGGLILSDNQKLMDNAFYWGQRAAPYRRDKDPYWFTYLYTGVGMNYAMPHLLGAIGRAQIENFSEILRRKTAVGQKYQELLSQIQGVRVQKIIESHKPVFWLNAIVLEDKTPAFTHQIGEELLEEGVEIRPGFWPLGEQPPFESSAWGKQDVGKYLFDHILVLPSSVYLENNNCKAVNEIVDILKSKLNPENNSQINSSAKDFSHQNPLL